MEAINGVRVRPALRERTVDDRTRQRFAAEHQAIVDRMAARDADSAAEKMREHLANVGARLHR
jgi:GntR family transcriptional regulator, transcriptional repressor for pyruvate dehydrogenase complex